MEFVPEKNYFITPDGMEYPLDDPFRVVLTEEGLGMPEISYITQRGPFQHGETLIDYRLNPRVIQLLFRHNGISRDHYWQSRSDLLNALRPNRAAFGNLSPSKFRKKFYDGTVRDIDVVSAGGPLFAARDLSKWDEWGFTEILRLIAYDPTFYDPEEKVLSWATMIESSFSGYITWPITFPIQMGTIISNKEAQVVYRGSWHSYPTIRITGPLENFILTNLSTGEFIRLNYDVPVGDIVTISLPFGNKTVVNSAGINLIGAISSDSNLATFHIASSPEVSGGINQFRVQSSSIDASSRVEMRYFERYIGL